MLSWCRVNFRGHRCLQFVSPANVWSFQYGSYIESPSGTPASIYIHIWSIYFNHGLGRVVYGNSFLYDIIWYHMYSFWDCSRWGWVQYSPIWKLNSKHECISDWGLEIYSFPFSNFKLQIAGRSLITTFLRTFTQLRTLWSHFLSTLTEPDALWSLFRGTLKQPDAL